MSHKTFISNSRYPFKKINHCFKYLKLKIIVNHLSLSVNTWEKTKKIVRFPKLSFFAYKNKPTIVAVNTETIVADNSIFKPNLATTSAFSPLIA